MNKVGAKFPNGKPLPQKSPKTVVGKGKHPKGGAVTKKPKVKGQK